MPKTFNDNPTRPKRALQIWQILINKAANRQTLTYKMLADLLGFQGAGTLAPILGHLMYYCQQHQLPPLTVIVVNQETGLPGNGLTTPENIHAEREQVFNFNWFALYPPSPEELLASNRIGENLRQRIDPLKTVPSVEDYCSGFGEISVENIEKNLLVIQYNLPNRTATATQLAELAEIGGGADQVNLFYDKMAHELGDAVQVKPATGEWWPVLSIGYNGENCFYWQMRDEVAAALERLEWVGTDR